MKSLNRKRLTQLGLDRLRYDPEIAPAKRADRDRGRSVSWPSGAHHAA